MSCFTSSYMTFYVRVFLPSWTRNPLSPGKRLARGRTYSLVKKSITGASCPYLRRKSTGSGSMSSGRTVALAGKSRAISEASSGAEKQRTVVALNVVDRRTSRVRGICDLVWWARVNLTPYFLPSALDFVQLWEERRSRTHCCKIEVTKTLSEQQGGL